jgi:hypothetical protein
MFSWPGPDAPLTMQSERTGIESKSYALKGRVVDLRAEEDGDLHIALQDATGDKPGIVVVEIPAKPEWCELRKIVFGWTEVQFPFRVRSGRKLKLSQPVVVPPQKMSTTATRTLVATHTLIVLFNSWGTFHAR